MEDLFLGLDGGQSSTLAAICDHTGRLLGIGRGGPSNHVHEPGGMERLERALREAVLSAWKNARQNPSMLLPEKPAFTAACFGMTGGSEYVPSIITRYASIASVRAEVDIVTAHAGALAGRSGVTVIAGTGSVAYGTNDKGQTARAGGWAYIMGDEGSGYDIGRKALIAAARVVDGRGPATALLQEVLDEFDCNDLLEVRASVYSSEIDRSRIARLARRVSAAAADGDPVAGQILDDAGRELAEISEAVLRRLELDQVEAHVSYVGGVFKAGESILIPFQKYLHQRSPLVEVLAPVFPPVTGALLMALKDGGVEASQDVLMNLERGSLVLSNKAK